MATSRGLYRVHSVRDLGRPEFAIYVVDRTSGATVPLSLRFTTRRRAMDALTHLVEADAADGSAAVEPPPRSLRRPRALAPTASRGERSTASQSRSQYVQPALL